LQVHLKFELMPETLFLMTNLIDRFLSVHVIARKDLQLVGLTALLLASKYEEIWPPKVENVHKRQTCSLPSSSLCGFHLAQAFLSFCPSPCAISIWYSCFACSLIWIQVDDLIEISKNSYTHEQVLSMVILLFIMYSSDLCCLMLMR